jgi:nitroreductase
VLIFVLLLPREMIGKLKEEMKMQEEMLMDLMISRRSIRKYTSEPIAEGKILQIVKAGMYAPTARNEQPWHFVLINERSIMKEIVNFHPHATMLEHASWAIFVCADLRLEKSPGYWMVDCASATQNLLLAAHSLGIGSVWLGIYPREERMNGMKNLFKLPDYIMPFSLVSLGYPAETKETPDRFNSARIHYNGINIE